MNRRCVECGAPQTVERANVPYPESGLDGVELLNVPVWVCENGHREVEIPAIEELHNLLAHMIIRQPTPLTGKDVRFVRKRIGLTARQLSEKIGRTPEWISQLENGHATLDRPNELLFRLVLGVLAAQKAGTSPDDLAPLIDELEQVIDAGSIRVRHKENASPSHEWEAANP